MRKTWVAAAVLAVAGMVWAIDGRPGMVKTKAGVVYDGTVEERDGNVIVNVRGIDTTLNRDEVDSIVYGTFEERWAADYQKLDAKDTAGRISFARRAFDERRYDLAEKALKDAQAIDPNNAEAAELLKTISNQRRLEAAKGAPPTNPTPGGPGAIKPIAPWNTLDGEQVNRIKQAELREQDERIRVSFGNNVLKKFYDATPRLADTYRDFNQFRNAPAVVQAYRIIQDGTPEMRKDVRITNDPQVIVDFRSDVQPLILQGCATSACHGGMNPASAKFSLVSPAADASATYTNFYILQSAKKKLPTPPQTNSLTATPDTAYMLDRTRSEQSLLLQYGLADQYAEMKHPKVRGYNGVFLRGRDDPKYRVVQDFIKTLSPVQPDYGFEFKLERKAAAGAASQPDKE